MKKPAVPVQLAIGATLVAIVSGVVSSCATMKNQYDAKVKETAQIKSDVAVVSKELQDHITFTEPLIKEHRDAMALIPTIADRSLRAIADINELNRKIDWLIKFQLEQREGRWGRDDTTRRPNR